MYAIIFRLKIVSLFSVRSTKKYTLGEVVILYPTLKL